MLDIYHFPRSRSNRVIWLCEELGIPYRAIPTDRFGEKPPELLAHNPAATIPYIVDGEVQLFESITILEYLVDKHGPTELVLRPDEPGYWDYRQMLMFGEATLAAPINAIVGTVFLAPEDQRRNVTTDVIHMTFKKRMAVIASRLETSDYVAGGRFTIADISCVYVIILILKTQVFGMRDLIPEPLVAYAQRLMERPAYQRMIKVR